MKKRWYLAKSTITEEIYVCNIFYSVKKNPSSITDLIAGGKPGGLVFILYFKILSSFISFDI